MYKQPAMALTGTKKTIDLWKEIKSYNNYYQYGANGQQAVCIINDLSLGGMENTGGNKVVRAENVKRNNNMRKDKFICTTEQEERKKTTLASFMTIYFACSLLSSRLQQKRSISRIVQSSQYKILLFFMQDPRYRVHYFS